jgi:hypothetical protein
LKGGYQLGTTGETDDGDIEIDVVFPKYMKNYFKRGINYE